MSITHKQIHIVACGLPTEEFKCHSREVARISAYGNIRNLEHSGTFQNIPEHQVRARRSV